MQIQSIPGWQEHILTGSKYLNTASNGRSRPAVFNNELVFQLAAMAIENFIVGISQYHHQMPTDHTLSGLVDALSPVCSMEAELIDRIKAIEKADDMCSLAPIHRSTPSDMAIQRILDVGRQVAGFARQHVPWDNLNPIATNT